MKTSKAPIKQKHASKLKNNHLQVEIWVIDGLIYMLNIVTYNWVGVWFVLHKIY